MQPSIRLSVGETLLFASRRHWLALIVPVLCVVFAGTLQLAGSCARYPTIEVLHPCLLITILTVVVASTPFVLEWLTTWFILTNERVLLSQSPVWLRQRSLWLTEIASVSSEQGVLGRLLGFGTVRVDTAASQAGRITFDYVPDPRGAEAQIAAAVTARQLRGA